MGEGKREFAITIDEVEYDVVADGKKITINGRPFTVETGPKGLVLVDGIAYDVALEGDRVHVGGRSHTVEVTGLSLRSGELAAATGPVPSPAKPGDGAVVAIMPGKVTRVLVEEGQAVEEGEPVCVLEAMKMENELRTDRAGVIGTVHVNPGDDVEKGQVLVDVIRTDS